MTKSKLIVYILFNFCFSSENGQSLVELIDSIRVVWFS